MNYFYLATFKILCVFVILHFDINISQCASLWMVSHKTLKLSWLSSSFLIFFYWTIDSIISSDLTLNCLILSSVWLILLLKPSSEYIDSIIVFLSSKMSVWFSFTVSISLLTFPFWPSIIILISFNCPSMFYLAYWASLRWLF